MGWLDIFKSSKATSLPAKQELLNNSKVFCMAAWVHQHVAVHGEIFPCCLSAHYLQEALGDLKQGDTILEAWNSDRSKQLRLNMLDNKKSKLCGLCYKYEELGKESTRHQMNDQFKHLFNRVEEMNPDGSMPHHELAYLDIRLSNLCNFKCRICSHYFSSKWYDDAKAMGMINEGFNRMVYPAENLDNFWEQLEPVLPKLEKVHFAGGEPLILDNHYKILQYFIDNGLTHVKLSYNTNFSDFVLKGQDAMEMWKHFDTIYLCASLDGAGKRGEYMRKGQNWDKVITERKRMLAVAPHILFELTPTISIMNVWHFPDFYREWVDEGLMQPHEMNIYLLFEPDYYNIRRLPKNFKEKVKAKYHEFIENYIKPMGKKGEKAKGHFEYIIRYMHEDDQAMSKEFYTYNQKLDEMRNEKMEDVFPELKEILLP